MSKQSEVEKMLARYPDRVPILVAKKPNSQAPPINKTKFMVPKDLSFNQFAFVVRRRLGIQSKEALFFFVDNKLIGMNDNIGILYNQKHSSDKLIHIFYDIENTFG